MTLDVTFVKGSTRRYRSRLRRHDGVVIEFEGGSYNRVGGGAGEVPHDVAHLVVEDALGLADGVWGVLAAGGLFGLGAVVEGRQRPHALERGRALVRESHGPVMHAELLTRAVCDMAVAGRASLAGLEADVTAAELDRAIAGLQRAGVAWAALAPGEELGFAWRLPVPKGAPAAARR